MKVVACSKVLFGLKIVNCSEDETFGNLISRLEEEHFLERRVEKVNIKDDKHRHEGYLIFFITGHPDLYSDQASSNIQYVGLA